MFPFASLRAAVCPPPMGAVCIFFPKVSNFLRLVCVRVCVKATDCRRVCAPVCLAWPHCLALGPPRRQFLVVAAKHLLLRFQISNKSLFFCSCAYKCVCLCACVCFPPSSLLTCGPSDLASDKRCSLMLRPLPLLSLALSAKIWCLRSPDRLFSFSLLLLSQVLADPHLEDKQEIYGPFRRAQC